MRDEADSPDGAFPPLGSADDLQQRLRLVPPGDTARGFVFGTILDVVRREAEPEALARCTAAAGETSFVPFFHYPLASLLRLLYTAAGELSGKSGGVEAAMGRLGGASVPHFLQSALGRVLLSATGMSVKQLVNTVPTTFPMIFHHGVCTVTWTGARSGHVRMSGVLLPCPFIEASMLNTVAPLKPRDFKLRVWRPALMEIKSEYSWD